MNQKNDTVFVKVWKLFNKNGGGKEPPYYLYYSLWTIITKPIRKWFSAVVIPTIPFSNLRVQCYRWCGYKIGKGTFIGMRCYLDDMCYDLLEIGDNVTISYGVYFACHGKNQEHNRMIIQNGAYIGMRATLVARSQEGLIIGENAVVGACALVNKSVPQGATVVGIPAKILVH